MGSVNRNVVLFLCPLRFSPDHSFVGFDNAFDDRKADDYSHGRTVRFLEPVEDPFEIRDSTPIPLSCTKKTGVPSTHWRRLVMRSTTRVFKNNMRRVMDNNRDEQDPDNNSIISLSFKNKHVGPVTGCIR